MNLNILDQRFVGVHMHPYTEVVGVGREYDIIASYHNITHHIS